MRKSNDLYIVKFFDCKRKVQKKHSMKLHVTKVNKIPGTPTII